MLNPRPPEPQRTSPISKASEERPEQKDAGNAIPFPEKPSGETGKESEKPTAESEPVKKFFKLEFEEVNQILRTGGGREGSRYRIYRACFEGKSPEEMADFLKGEYGETGKGFHVRGRPVSMWAHESGIRLGYGKSAFSKRLLSIDWELAGKWLPALAREGQYLSQEEIPLAWEGERKDLATDLAAFFQYVTGGIPEPLSASGISTAGEMAEAMRERESILKITEVFEDVWGKLPDGMAFPGNVKPPEELLDDIDSLYRKIPPIGWGKNLPPIAPDFITQDEIDAVLKGGGIREGGKFRIYGQFITETDADKNAGFLKNEYGDGGHSGASPGCDRSWENHDAKGISLTKGDLMAPDLAMLLSWTQVEKRVRELVAEGKYLSEEELAGFQQSQLEKAKERLEANKGATDKEEPVSAIREAANQEETDAKDDAKLVSKTDAEENLGQEPALDLHGTNEPDGGLKLKSIVIDLTPRSKDHDIEIQAPTASGIPEIPAENFHITDMYLGKGSPREKCGRNFLAIRTMKQIESERRNATREEQKILSQYVGWGGLPEVFDESKASWKTEYEELKNLLTEREYAAARGSVLNAHYTTPLIISGIYGVLERMGFAKGNVLEPSMGVGNFFGMLPETM